MRIGVITCKNLPEPDPDQEMLLGEFARAGHEASMLAWDGERKPGDFDVCVLHSAWNYFEDPPAFLQYLTLIEETSSLWNPLPVVRENLEKTYLMRLEQRGIPIVPTRFRARGESPDLAPLWNASGWEDIVIKPMISAGSFATRRFAPNQMAEAEAFFASQLRQRGMMVQRFMPSVEDYGERALIWIDGELTHAVRKTPRFAEDDEKVSEALTITPAERELAEAILEPLRDQILYARVDVVPDEAGNPLLAELELIEPSKFFLQHPPALERFVGGVVRRGCFS